jgi:hypothetical protein
MNTIEAVTAPEQAKQQEKPAERPAPDLPPLRVFVKENNAYVLQDESTDFQLAMRKAEQLYNNGQDILVNEKGSPQVVHAKSNLHDDVDVGREVQPTEKDGSFVRNSGEVLLESFFQKLPLNSDAFDKQQKEKAAQATPSETKQDSQTKASSTPAKSSPVEATGPVVDGSATSVKLAKAEPDAPAKDTSATPTRKAILKKTGFVLPEQVLAAYTIKDGRYHDKTSDALRFQDHGKKLSTQVEDRAVVTDMLAIAAAKNWDHIELKGSETFRQMAWQEAELRGIRTMGYKPSEHDLQQLEYLRRERGIGARIEAGLKADKDTKPVNTIEVTKDREVKAPTQQSAQAEERQAADRPVAQVSTKGRQTAEHSEAPVNGHEAKAQSSSGAPAPSSGKKGVIVGRLIDHGRANYNHDRDEKPSYFVTLQTQAGERTIWGKDLERSMAGRQFKAGDRIALEFKRADPVKVDANLRDESGTVTGHETISAHRNEWEVKPASLVVMRTLSADEKLKVDAAFRILNKELAKYPEDLRREILGRFTQGVENGNMKLPTPQVAEKSAQAKVSRQPELERSR